MYRSEALYAEDLCLVRGTARPLVRNWNVASRSELGVTPHTVACLTNSQNQKYLSSLSCLVHREGLKMPLNLVSKYTLIHISEKGTLNADMKRLQNSLPLFYC